VAVTDVRFIAKFSHKISPRLRLLTLIIQLNKP
jgi:hypothetical protein